MSPLATGGTSLDDSDSAVRLWVPRLRFAALKGLRVLVGVEIGSSVEVSSRPVYLYSSKWV